MAPLFRTNYDNDIRTIKCVGVDMRPNISTVTMTRKTFTEIAIAFNILYSLMFHFRILLVSLSGSLR